MQLKFCQLPSSKIKGDMPEGKRFVAVTMFAHVSIYELAYIILLQREKCPNTELFWSVFSVIRAECEDLHSKSPY